MRCKRHSCTVHTRNIIWVRGCFQNVKVPSSPYKRGREARVKGFTTFEAWAVFGRFSVSSCVIAVLERVYCTFSRVRGFHPNFRRPPTPLKSLLQLDFRPTSVPQVNDFFRSPQVNYFAVYSTLQAIFVICSLGFWFQLTSFTSEIQIDVSDSNFHMNQFACSFSEAVTIGTADNYKLDTSKCVVLWLHTGCDCAASNFSA
jgi:hypothetical protein